MKKIWTEQTDTDTFIHDWFQLNLRDCLDDLREFFNMVFTLLFFITYVEINYWACLKPKTGDPISPYCIETVIGTETSMVFRSKIYFILITQRLIWMLNS